MIKDYVRMFPMENGLVSEVFTDLQDAQHFADVLHQNYKAVVFVRKTFTNGEFVVFTKSIKYTLIKSNFNKKYNEYQFCNWIKQNS